MTRTLLKNVVNRLGIAVDVDEIAPTAIRREVYINSRASIGHVEGGSCRRVHGVGSRIDLVCRSGDSERCNVFSTQALGLDETVGI